MSTQLEQTSFDDSYFQQNLDALYRITVHKIVRLTNVFLWVHASFCSLFLLELVFLFVFIPLFHLFGIALLLSAIFFSVFSYCMALFYMQAKKPEQFEEIHRQFVSSCRRMVGVSVDEAQQHLSIAAALNKLDSFLAQPRSLPVLLSFFARWEARDYLRIRSLFLSAALNEQLRQLRMTPTDLEVHASLAGTYIALSKLFRSSAKEELALAASQLAIEEFKILNDYAPNDPWVHEQLAQGYCDLGKHQEELIEVEHLVRLRPQDRDLLLRLGTLYFGQGLNAKGLRIYEELKKTHYKKAEDLIASYGKREWLGID